MAEAPTGAPMSPLSLVFLLHIFLELPFVLQGMMGTHSMPFLDLSNTTLVMIKLYAGLSFGVSVAAFLVFRLPEFLPGKRALALALMLYHTIAFTLLFQSPRFIPISFGPMFETLKLTPEHVWGIAHGICGGGFALWWQGTLVYAQMAAKLMPGVAQ